VSHPVTSGKQQPRKRFAFSMLSSALAIIAVASALLLAHDWGKTAIPAIEWICGTSAVLLLASMILDWRRP
jgi:hypothetical protein